MREIPFSAIQLPIYEIMKGISASVLGKSESEFSMLNYAINGSIAGTIAAFLTTPIDVVKTKLMTNRTIKNYGLVDCCKKISKEEGFKGFWRAWHVRSGSLALGSIIYFSAYETTKKHIQGIVNSSK